MSSYSRVRHGAGCVRPWSGVGSLTS